MKYNLTLFFNHGNPAKRMDLQILDRDRNIIPVSSTTQSGSLIVSLEVSMPNRLFLLVSGKVVQDQDVFLEVKSMSLGGIRFSNNKIDDLFEFKSADGAPKTLDEYLSLEPVKTRLWDSNGCAIIELFDNDPIRYHLHLETVGLSPFQY